MNEWTFLKWGNINRAWVQSFVFFFIWVALVRLGTFDQVILLVFTFFTVICFFPHFSSYYTNFWGDPRTGKVFRSQIYTKCTKIKKTRFLVLFFAMPWKCYSVWKKSENISLISHTFFKLHKLDNISSLYRLYSKLILFKMRFQAMIKVKVKFS